MIQFFATNTTYSIICRNTIPRQEQVGRWWSGNRHNGVDAFQFVSSFHDFRVHTTIANLGDFTIPEYDTVHPLRHLTRIAGEGSTEDSHLLGKQDGVHEDIHIDGCGSLSRTDIDQLWQRHLSVCQNRSDTERRSDARRSVKQKNGGDETVKRQRFREPAADEDECSTTTSPTQKTQMKWLDQQWLNLAADQLRVIGRTFLWTAEDRIQIYETVFRLWIRTSAIRTPEFNQYYIYAIMSIAAKFHHDLQDLHVTDVLPRGYGDQLVESVKIAERNVLKFIDFRIN